MAKKEFRIVELEEVRQQRGIYLLDKKNYYQRRKLVLKFISFFNWHLNYCEINLPKKKYSNKLLIECVLREDIKSEKQKKEYLYKSLYISKIYVNFMKDFLTTRNINALENTLMSLEIDLGELIISFEKDCKSKTFDFKIGAWRRKNLTSYDIYRSAKSLFHIEKYYKVEDIYLRDLKPLVMFQIRQLLEIFGKEMIGYYSITTKAGVPIKKFTQAAWAFVKDELKKEFPRIKFKFEINSILKINSWANSFVHTTFIYNSYIQYFILEYLKEIFQPAKKSIKVYSGKYAEKGHPEIRIEHYESLKIDFEEFLREKIRDVKIDWMPVDRVSAYIISL